MLDLFKSSCNECSKLITQRYSTSFSLGIKAFELQYRKPIYNLYGFVRFADEIVDTFHGFNKEQLLEKFSSDTFEAINNGISLNPILQSFQETVNQYNIDHSHIRAFLDSMAMDLKSIEYDQQTLKRYIYGSAEVVGLMCLKVFCLGNQTQYDKLEPYAISLGSAFQKINFLRDLKDDFEDKGRVYFPGIDFNNFSVSDKREIEKDISKEFQHAYIGIKMLPKGVRLGVFLAYKYYLSLFQKIKKAAPEEILQKRFRVHDGKKMLLYTSSAIKYRLNIL